MPERQARRLGFLGPGESYVQSPEEVMLVRRLRYELRVLVEELGRVQTGYPPTREWVDHAAMQLGEAATGVERWSLEHENFPAALEAVIQLTKEQLTSERRKAIPDDCPI